MTWGGADVISMAPSGSVAALEVAAVGESTVVVDEMSVAAVLGSPLLISGSGFGDPTRMPQLSITTPMVVLV